MPHLMPRHASDIRAALEPYRDLLLFVAAMLFADAFWKLTVHGDDTSVSVSWLCFDLTPFFDVLARHTAQSVYELLHKYKPELYLSDSLVLGYTGGSGTHIAWSCTPVKQAFIFTAIILAAQPYLIQDSRALHKLWFVPLGIALIYIVNILRIAVIVLIIEHRPDLFSVFHDGVLKYLFYGFIFCLWLQWIVMSAPSIPQDSSDDTAPTADTD